MSLRRFALICALPAMLAAPAAAEPTIGLGLSFSFGARGVDTGVGLRVFSDNRRDRAVGSLGVDYMFGSQSWRGTIGAGYLGNNTYIGLDLGIGLRDGTIDFGVGVGGANTKRAPSGGNGGGETEGPAPVVPGPGGTDDVPRDDRDAPIV